MDARISKESKPDQQPPALPHSDGISEAGLLADEPGSREIAAEPSPTAPPLVLKVRVSGGLDVEALRQAWHRLVREDSRLRTLFLDFSTRLDRNEDFEQSAYLEWEEHHCRDLTSDQFALWQQDFLRTESARALRRDRFPLLRFFLLLLEREAQMIWILHPTYIDSGEARQVVERLILKYREMRKRAKKSEPSLPGTITPAARRGARLGSRRSESWTLIESPTANQWCYTVGTEDPPDQPSAAESADGLNEGKLAAAENTESNNGVREGLRHSEEARVRLETQLRKIWQGVFKKEEIALDDDFFALGGHSLLAAKLLTRIHKVFGKELTFASLLDFPTIEGQARLLSGVDAGVGTKGRETSSELSAEPAFILLGADPTFQPLTEELKKRYRVRSIGLSAALLGGLNPSDSLEQIAARCNDELKHAVPGKRYVLAGWCNHGVLALEMAKQLRQEGIKVPLVVMLQTSNPVALQAYPSWKRFISRTQLNWHLTKFEILYVRHLGWKRGGQYLYNRLQQSFSPSPRHSERTKEFSDSENEARFERDYFDFLHGAAARYQPAGYDAPVVLFRGKQKTYGFASIRDLGWGDLLGKKFAVAEVDGNHFTMFIPPYADGLAKKMEDYIRSAEAAENS